MNDTLTDFRRAYRVAVPLVAVTSYDAAFTEKSLRSTLPEGVGSVRWDAGNAFKDLDELGCTALQNVPNPQQTFNPISALKAIQDLPDRTVVFAHNLSPFLERPEVAQACWNLREHNRGASKMLVLIESALLLPPLLAQDFLVLEDQLPTPEELTEILTNVESSLHESRPDHHIELNAVERQNCIAALMGLSGFAAEQALLLSVAGTTFQPSIEKVWSLKRSIIEQTPGLRFESKSPGLDEIGGLHYIKRIVDRLFTTGYNRPVMIVLLDEIEKQLGGSSTTGGDSSGVSQDALGVLLRELNDNEWTGILAIGAPGSGKSALPKAVATTHKIPCTSMDLGAMKGSLVGSSEARIRAAMKVIKAMGGKNVLVWATSNSVNSLPPELRRRFILGEYYFDLPNEEERNSIWTICRRQHLVPDTYTQPPSPEWTGGEINGCCKVTRMLGCSLEEAAGSFVPLARRAPKMIEDLRQQAAGTFKSASYDGAYRRETPTQNRPLETGARKLSL